MDERTKGTRLCNVSARSHLCDCNTGAEGTSDVLLVHRHVSSGLRYRCMDGVSRVKVTKWAVVRVTGVDDCCYLLEDDDIVCLLTAWMHQPHRSSSPGTALRVPIHAQTAHRITATLPPSAAAARPHSRTVASPTTFRVSFCLHSHTHSCAPDSGLLLRTALITRPPSHTLSDVDHTTSATSHLPLPLSAAHISAMSDPTQERPISQSDVDAQGRLPLGHRLHHAVHREINSSKNTCGAVPCASRMPDIRLTILVLGGETTYGSHIVRGLTNPAYSTAFDVRALEMSVVRQCADVSSLSGLLRGAHTVILADCCIVWRDGKYVDVSDDKSWQILIEACERAEVKRFVPSPFEWDLQLARPAKKNEPDPPEPIRRATERQVLLTNQKTLNYTLISLGVLTEQLFSPLAGVDVEGGIVREPAGLGWQTMITTTTLDDVARMLPEILLSSKSHNTKVRLASATLTYEDVARIVEETTGKVAQNTHSSSTTYDCRKCTCCQARLLIVSLALLVSPVLCRVCSV